ncbi:hypothetical protein F4825DRAFT_431195 [Nemania diffusa]|nr:hypothetical protein F4825DRAFT_431195 [Nemania diffusa]
MSTLSISNVRSIPSFGENPLEDHTTQDISGRYISSSKLVHMLRNKFGPDAYDVHVAHNSFCIKAPRKLTTDEIAECRR